MQLFYSDLLTPESQEYMLSRDESKHVIRVLRKNVGDTIYLTNGNGYLFTANVFSANPNKCLLKITSRSYQEPSSYKLHLAVAPTKNNDRYEWFLEKATEIGVSEITPILCTNSERKTIKKERFQKILQSAMKQSHQYHLPVLNEIMPLEEFINTNKAQPNNYIAHCEKDSKAFLKLVVLPETDSTILIGPEGDFTPAEISTAIQASFKPVSLGKSRLRTETAAVVACHTFSLVNQ